MRKNFLQVILEGNLGELFSFLLGKKKIDRLKEEYDNALNGNDKRVALEAGRAYYRELRRDKNLTIYDEQAIANDLATMRG
jgi:hypothetical protein